MVQYYSIWNSRYYAVFIEMYICAAILRHYGTMGIEYCCSSLPVMQKLILAAAFHVLHHSHPILPSFLLRSLHSCHTPATIRWEEEKEVSSEDIKPRAMYMRRPSICTMTRRSRLITKGTATTGSVQAAMMEGLVEGSVS